jgi:hypothetical protein
MGRIAILNRFEYRDAEYEYRDAEYENKKTTLRDDFEDGFDLDGRAGWDLGKAQSASGVEAVGIFAVDFVEQIAATVDHEVLFVEFEG